MSTKTLVWVLFIFLSLTWGSSFILMKKAMFPGGDDLMVLGPFQVGALRISIAGLVLFPFAVKFRKHLTRKTLPLLFIVGFFGSLMPAMMFTLAETNINSSLAGLVNMATSFFVIIIGVIFYKSKPSSIQLFGLGLGSVGLFLVLNSQSDISLNKDIRYALFLFPATIGYAISLTTIKFKLQEIPSTAITALSFALVLPLSLIALFLTGTISSITSQELGFHALGFVTILAVVGTAIAVLLFTKLISLSNHVFSSAIAYMLPVVAIFIGVLDGESFPLINLFWVGLILIGVYLMNRSVKSKTLNTSQNNVN